MVCSASPGPDLAFYIECVLKLPCFSGVIGTGLFLGTASSLAEAGPVGLLLGYIAIGTVCYSVMVRNPMHPRSEFISSYASLSPRFPLEKWLPTFPCPVVTSSSLSASWILRSRSLWWVVSQSLPQH